MNFPLMARQLVLARECLITLVAHDTLRRIPALFGPDLVVAPDMSILLALALCLSPAAVFFGTLTVGGGVTSEGR
jgi:hypothetical protein